MCITGKSLHEYRKQHRNVHVYTVNTPCAHHTHHISPWWNQSKMDFPVLRLVLIRCECREHAGVNADVLVPAVSCIHAGTFL